MFIQAINRTLLKIICDNPDRNNTIYVNKWIIPGMYFPFGQIRTLNVRGRLSCAPDPELTR
jgi:hypothetical protein